MRARFLRAATVLLSGALLPIVTAAPALARVDDGESPSHTGVLYVLGVYVAIPIAIFLILAVLVYAPSMLRQPRYRPARAWEHEAVWFNGPDEPDTAIANVGDIVVKGGGASASW